jgi:hypothetical protein
MNVHKGASVTPEPITSYFAFIWLKPPTLLGDAVLLVAAIGGYLGRKNDPPPGYQLLWLGYTAFQHMSAGYSLIEDG